MRVHHLCALVATLAGVACSPHYVISRPFDFTAITAPQLGLTKNVVLVSIDGLRPDAIAKFEAPTLRRLMREGTYSLSARTVLPSTTLPSHTSMLSGEPPDQHGVLWNNVTSAKLDVVAFSTVFGVARAHGYRTAAFFSKAKFHPLQQPDTLDYSQAPGGWFGRWSASRTVADVRSHLEEAKPNLLFVHLSNPDSAGHSSGWMSEAYSRAVEETDEALGDLLSAAETAYGEGNFSVLITADHGGHGFGHGSDDPRDVTIPWIAWGRGVNPVGVLDHLSIATIDTAPTVLWLLGVERPEAWDGRPVLDAFHPLGPAPALALTTSP
jgi:predicted AlkP superfamily pyrophosphatase or phosphodiesterase